MEILIILMFGVGATGFALACIWCLVKAIFSAATDVDRRK